MKIREHFTVLLLLFFVNASIIAQSDITISGSVVDAINNEPLSFATVSLKKQMIGIITNESGYFDLRVPANLTDDSLVISYFGYKTQTFSLKTVSSPLNVRLKQTSVALNEIIVKPQPPEFYIKLAILCAKSNYPNEPFQTEAYYREKILENKNFLKCNEGIFKTYCPNYLDTVKNQNQLLLFRQEENIHEIEFMAKERKEAEEKEQKKIAKQNEKNQKKGVAPVQKPGKQNNLAIDMAGSMGGPSAILSMGSIKGSSNDFLDTASFKNYKYTFAKATSFNNSDLMVIDFKSKGKVEHVRSNGKIYIDVASYAIVKVESNGDFIIPVLIRPILFLYGFGIENPTFHSVTEYQQIQRRWYPKNIQYNININISNKHLFSPDEHSDFLIEGIYTVNKTRIDNVSAIPTAKRFNPDKEMKPQVHNDGGITWDGINIIKK
ncbi:MAG: carboxypeptidase-like regulatory domain-containing protein [Bacteroidetes bacterium]|nr:carboxypeptidase-like regulatory domain-containing protein [Bacteroidota bacterium]